MTDRTLTTFYLPPGTEKAIHVTSLTTTQVPVQGSSSYIEGFVYQVCWGGEYQVVKRGREYYVGKGRQNHLPCDIKAIHGNESEDPDPYQKKQIHNTA